MKTKNNGKKMTLDKLVQITQQEFVSVREEMGDMKKELKENITLLRRDTEAGFSMMGDSMKAIMSKLNEIQRDVVEIHDLRGRVERLEKLVIRR